jgi:AAA15 family ATPase/GTPase
MGDTSKHLTYFKVENFKRFESFEMKDLSQFNLIVGDNNVGKTSVLEALLVDESDTILLSNFAQALSFRKIKSSYSIEDVDFYANKSIALSGMYSINFEWSAGDIENTKLSIVFNDFNRTVEFKRHGLLKNPVNGRGNYSYMDSLNSYSHIKCNFIPFYKGHDIDLSNFYKGLQKSIDRKENFINGLKLIIPTITGIEPSVDDHIPGLLIFQSSVKAAIPLSLFGDGALKLFRLLAEIVLNNGGRLMIDEIDTGIYFKRFKNFWKVILQTAKENDVQLFMTTHNEECIRYFKEVIEEDLPDLKKDVRNITLVENPKTKAVTSHTYDFEQFEHAINVGNEVRG